MLYLQSVMRIDMNFAKVNMELSTKDIFGEWDKKILWQSKP